MVKKMITIEGKEVDRHLNTDDEISVIDIILFLWKYKVIIAISAILTTVLAIAYCFIAKESYTTQTLFFTKTSSSSNSNIASLASLAGISLGGNNSVDPSDYLDKVIQDKYFLTKIINRKWKFKGDSLYLHQIWELKPDTMLPDWRYRFEMEKIEYIRNQNIFTITKDKRTGILTLNVKAPDPELSFELSLYTIDKISDYIRNSIQSQAKEKRLFVEKRIDEIKADLEKSENVLALFRERNFSSSSPKIILEEMRLTRDVTMNQELYIQFQKQYELVLIEEKDDQTLVQIIKNPEVPVYRTWPKRKQIVVLSCIIGCSIGCTISGILFVWEKIRKKKKSNA